MTVSLSLIRFENKLFILPEPAQFFLSKKEFKNVMKNQTFPIELATVCSVPRSESTDPENNFFKDSII